MPIIDVERPLEAVHKATGGIVPMEFAAMAPDLADGAFYTMEAPCPETSNSAWAADGEDWCNHKQWIIRNVKEHTMSTLTVAQITEAAAAIKARSEAMDGLSRIGDNPAKVAIRVGGNTFVLVEPEFAKSALELSRDRANATLISLKVTG